MRDRLKVSKERIIPFGPRTVAAMTSYLATRTVRFPAAEDIVFLNARGRGLTRSGFGWRLAAAARRAGLSGRFRNAQLAARGNDLPESDDDENSEEEADS